MPPAFALSQDQTLRFIIQSSADRSQSSDKSQNRSQTHQPSNSARGAQSRQPLQTKRVRKTEYANASHEAASPIRSRENPQITHPAKQPPPQQCSRIAATGRRQRIPSSPIHISKNKPDRPAPAPLTENQRNQSSHLLTQGQET